MLDNLPSYMLLAFILGASFAFGIWSFAMVAGRFLPTPSVLRQPGSEITSSLEIAKQLQLKRVDVRNEKIYVQIFNCSTHTYSNFLFRVTFRDEDGQLIEDHTCVVHGFARPQAEFDCLLSPCKRSEHWGIVDPDKSVKVELVHATTA